MSPANSRWSGRTGARKRRVLRRVCALLLLVAAGIAATWQTATPTEGYVVIAARELAVGSVLESADVTTLATLDPPDGVITDVERAVGQVLSSPVRRGEILTDARLVPTDGPRAGPGRRAVAVRPADPAIAEVLSAGARVAVIGIDQTGAPVVLTPQAIVLWMPAVGSASNRSEPVLLSVAEPDADRVTAATLTGEIALRFAT
ncbi:SAF domain-containing protein [Nakamurella antarctica]|nr:SAF domain-containing protein [Nakamurella antarctica]